MYYLLYNPLSMAGKSSKVVLKIQKKLEKKNHPSKIFSLIEIDLNEKLLGIYKEDIVIIIGGDGTLHRVINEIDLKVVPCRVFFYKAGSGNDFARGHKGRCFEVTKEMKSLPYYEVGGKKITFLNGLGIGIDALVCDEVNKNNKSESYFKTAVRCFKTFKPFSIDVEIDNERLHFDNVWFFVVNNGKYFGGGMKIAPKAIRLDDYLDFVVVHKISKARLLRIFPLIFIGKHTWCKKGVFIRQGKKFHIIANGYDTMQSDGEVNHHINEIKVYRN